MPQVLDPESKYADVWLPAEVLLDYTFLELLSPLKQNMTLYLNKDFTNRILEGILFVFFCFKESRIL